jgi:hypothetical protein
VENTFILQRRLKSIRENKMADVNEFELLLLKNSNETMTFMAWHGQLSLRT